MRNVGRLKRMGYIASIVIAGRKEAQAVADSLNPLSQWPGFDASGLTTKELIVLQCALFGEISEEAYFQHRKEFSTGQFDSASDESAYATILPDSFVRSLSSITAQASNEIVRQWTAFPLVNFEHLKPAFLQQTVVRLSEAARSAVADDKVIFIHLTE
jgi:hypothetical protein